MFDLPNSPYLDLPLRSLAQARADRAARLPAVEPLTRPTFAVCWVSADCDGVSYGELWACRSAREAMARLDRMNRMIGQNGSDGVELFEHVAGYGWRVSRGRVSAALAASPF